MRQSTLLTNKISRRNSRITPVLSLLTVIIAAFGLYKTLTSLKEQEQKQQLLQNQVIGIQQLEQSQQTLLHSLQIEQARQDSVINSLLSKDKPPHN